MIDLSRSYYTVQPGDTFSSLALRFYGNESRWPVIRDANPPLRRYNSHDTLPVGTRVTIP